MTTRSSKNTRKTFSGNVSASITEQKSTYFRPEAFQIPSSFDECCPAFCFKYLSCDKDYQGCNEKKEAVKFVQRLRTIGQLSWKEIGKLPHKGKGTEKLPRKQIDKAALNGINIKNILTNDVEDIEVFRIDEGGISRLLGLRHQKVFYVFAIDLSGRAYNHG